LGLGKHEIEVAFEARPFGSLTFLVDDAISEAEPFVPRIPRDPIDDFTPEVVGQRQAFVAEATGARLEHIRQFSFDPHLVKGNCENFTGVSSSTRVRIVFTTPSRNVRYFASKSAFSTLKLAFTARSVVERTRGA
jgi:hypothetical protein